MWAKCGRALWVVLMISSCKGRTLFEVEDETVVSKYTTLPPTVKTSAPLDVYQQIANNIAERITSPIYRLFGYNVTTTTEKPNWIHLELVDETPEEVTKSEVKPVENEIEVERDVEELSPEALAKTKNKPEKVKLDTGYLPLERMDKANEIDSNSTSSLPDDDEFDFEEFEDTEEGKGESGFIYILEIVGSFFTLAWGAIMAYFRPNTST